MELKSLKEWTLWIVETWQAGQWGMFLLSLCFFAGYARGVFRKTNA